MSKIEQKDLPLLSRLTNQVLATEHYIALERLGGLTNRTYKVVLENHEAYTIRIPGEGTEEMISRSNERVSTVLASELGVDAQLLYFGDKGEKVSRYITNAQTMSVQLLRNPKQIAQMAEIFRKVHTCGVDTKVPFEVFDMAAGYEKIILNNAVVMNDDYDLVKEKVIQIKSMTDSSLSIKKVPCHNDPLCENWVLSDDRMYLIDWEYAGMNDPMWDLADVSIEACFDDECDMLLLKEYLGHAPSIDERRHFLASKIYVDYLWTLWAKARVPYDGQPMEDWAGERYARLKGFLDQYEAL